jgi:hypothetical protein
MFYSYTRSEHKNMIDRFVHQINAPVLVNISLLKSFVVEKRHGAMQMKKRKKREVEKNGHKDVWSIENNRYKDAHHEKKRKER